MRTLLILIGILLLPQPAVATGIATVLGIWSTWDIEETKNGFRREGIPEKTGIDRFALDRQMQQMLTTMVATLFEKTFMYNKLDPEKLPSLDCLYYEQAIEPRSDLDMVGICFAYERLVITALFLDGTTAEQLRPALQDEYGRINSELGVWEHKPWFHAGMIPRRFISLLDEDELASFPHGSDTIVVYFDAWNLHKLENDIEENDPIRQGL